MLEIYFGLGLVYVVLFVGFLRAKRKFFWLGGLFVLTALFTYLLLRFGSGL